MRSFLILRAALVTRISLEAAAAAAWSFSPSRIGRRRRRRRGDIRPYPHGSHVASAAVPTVRRFSSLSSSSSRHGEDLETGGDDSDLQGLEEDDDVEEDYTALPEGIPKGFYVVDQFELPNEAFDISSIDGIEEEDINRLELSPHNISLPVALQMVNPLEYLSFSQARKACRRGAILIHRGPLIQKNGQEEKTLDSTRCMIGRVGDRVHPGDVICRQVRMGSGYFPEMKYKKPPFDLPVVFQDDHFALVNKPAGVVVHSNKGGGHGIMTVRAALPFCLAPPSAGTYSVMRRPASVHRLDKPTSGILVIAKTKPAMVDLGRQFRDRIVKKTYMAIVNGIPHESEEGKISARQAFDLGVDVDPTIESGKTQYWNLIDSPLDGKHAVTVWRAVDYFPSLHAHDEYITLVEMKPKTGRFHQLRRHMAEVCERPLVGDKIYDGGTSSAMKFRERGLFLCSTQVVLEHPFYNSPEGRAVWDAMDNTISSNNLALWVCPESNKIMLRGIVGLPKKFETFLEHQSSRHHKFKAGDEDPSQL